MTFAGGTFGENIMEVRPKAGACIWSRAGEMVIPVIYPQRTTGNRAHGADEENNNIHFLFMGGKGCARVGLGGERLGGNQ